MSTPTRFLSAALLLSITLITPVTAAPRAPITHELLWLMQRVGAPVVSPDVVLALSSAATFALAIPGSQGQAQKFGVVTRAPPRPAVVAPAEHAPLVRNMDVSIFRKEFDGVVDAPYSAVKTTETIRVGDAFAWNISSVREASPPV